MSKRIAARDFRSDRSLLPDEVFLIPGGKRRGPTDPVSEEVWSGLMHLPDDVALTTSNHHGSQLAMLYGLWGNWIEAVGDVHDELFGVMLDAGDCFQASAFSTLHGFYRSAVSDLRSAFELMATGAVGNLVPNDSDYIRWKKHNIGGLPFATCLRKLRGATKGPIHSTALQHNGWMDALYEELSPYTHTRPDASDGEIWRSNGPIYVAAGFNRVFKLQLSTYAAGYVFAKLARPNFAAHRRPPEHGP